jgi:hypothetical protein
LSTKCYWGIRFPKTKLAEFVDYARTEYMLAAEAHARKWAEKISTKGEAYKERARKHNKQRGSPIRHTKNCWACKVSLAMRMFQEANVQPERRPWANLGCGVNIWTPLKGRYLLAHPWGERCTEIAWPDWVEEYGYWNNTDQPDGMSDLEWSRRSKAWDAVLQPNARERKLSMMGFDAEGKYTVDMSWLQLRLLDHKLSNGEPFGDPRGK